MLSIIAEQEALLPIRRIMNTLLRASQGCLAPLFHDAGEDTAGLVAIAAEESVDLGEGGDDFLIKVADWAERDVPGAREGLIAACRLDPTRIAPVAARTLNRSYLIEAWAGLDENDRLRFSPNWDGIFDSCSKKTKLHILEEIAKVQDGFHLRAVTMLAIADPDPEVKKRAIALVNSLLWLNLDQDADGADAQAVPVPAVSAQG